MQFTTFQVTMWCLNLAFQAGVIGVLHRTGLRQRFPLFFVYSISELMSTLVLMGLVLPFTHHGYLSQFSEVYHAYFYTWCGSQFIMFTLQLAVLWEIWRTVHLDKLAQANAFGGLLCFFIIVVVLWSNYSPVYSKAPYLRAMLTANRSVQFIICMMFSSLIILGNRLHLTWRHHVFCISAGLALYAAAGIFVSGLRSGSWLVSPTTYHRFVKLRDLIYIVSLVVWIFGLSHPEPVPGTPTAGEITKLKDILMHLRENPFYANRK